MCVACLKLVPWNRSRIAAHEKASWMKATGEEKRFFAKEIISKCKHGERNGSSEALNVSGVVPIQKMKDEIDDASPSKLLCQIFDARQSCRGTSFRQATHEPELSIDEPTPEGVKESPKEPEEYLEEAATTEPIIEEPKVQLSPVETIVASAEPLVEEKIDERLPEIAEIPIEIVPPCDQDIAEVLLNTMETVMSCITRSLLLKPFAIVRDFKIVHFQMKIDFNYASIQA